MRIKKLEIKGFKSFSDKTVLEFQPGITSVVGPNGCGKSNVLEAIRWVMGEQRARVLRGKRMEDIIFNGSENRKPVGMAEVRLMLSTDGGFCPPSMADYDEIMIARRLFRDGDSQYEINNVQCRLSDVTDFFLDTGVGRNSYAIIEQGRVDMVVASKPEDRRVLIEEAAGISRYKVRKEAAIKKLEQTQQNLLRISDIIGEVKRQNTSLKRQAAKAERYRNLRDRIRELDIGLHAFKSAQLLECVAASKQELEDQRSFLLEGEARYSTLHAELEEARLKALETERSLKELLESRHKTDIALTELRGSIERDKLRISQVVEFQERSHSEKRCLEEDVERAGTACTELENNQHQVAQDLQGKKAELERIVEELRASEEALADRKSLQNKLKDDIFRTLQESAQERNRRESLTRRETEALGRLKKITSESDEIHVQLNEERSQKDELNTKLKEIGRLREEKSAEKEDLQRLMKDARALIASLREDLANREQRQAAEQARLESLREMQASYASYGESVRFLMKEQASKEGNGLLGPLAEMIEVSPEYQRALAAALGERLGHVVVSNPREGAKAAQRLREAGAGRSTFIPVSPRHDRNGRPEQLPEGLKPLKEAVRFPEGLENLGDFLLTHSYLAENIQSAIEIWESNGFDADLVTIHGEVINRHGEITGGSTEQVREDLFEKRRQIEALEQTTRTLTEAADQLRASIKTEEAGLEHMAKESDALDRTISELSLQQADVRKDVEVLTSRAEGFESRLKILELEKDRFTSELQSVTAELKGTFENIALFEQRRDELEKESQDTARKVDELEEGLKTQSRAAADIQVGIAQLEERHRAVEREFASAKESADELRRRLSSLIQQMEGNASDVDGLKDEIQSAQAREKELMQEHEIQGRQIAALKEESALLASTASDLEEKTAQNEKTLKDRRESVHSLEMETVRIEQTLEGTVEKIIDRYGIDPRTVAPSEEPPNEGEITELKVKLEQMGEVNLAAIAESRYTEERLHFLTEQEEDLSTAVESLYATINKINKTTRERFREAFDSINAKFQEIFPFLFKGGEARLELTDEENLLETGVEIMARPPGKRIRNMDLLSGGEKALTAVALIFSIFLTRPSPFCLLDEVDASLDDANLMRFNEMLRKLCDKTQFLIITHNKITMEAADTLYGVTMEEPGASGVVSVEFAGYG